jgi:hypothetical protein
MAGNDSDSRLYPLGRVLFIGGMILVALRGIELFTRMPGLPAFWYANQPIWIIVGFGMAATGWTLLWGRSMFSSDTWRPSVPGRRFRTTTLYISDDGCHLCEDAVEVLANYASWLPIATEIDIHSDPALVKQFGTCVPVVMFDDKIRFRGKINETLLRRLIEGTPPLHFSNQ